MGIGRCPEGRRSRACCGRGGSKGVSMDISCAFPTALGSPEHVALAEELGYVRAWLYDTPQQSPDVWMMLALAAERTDRIGLGPGVLVPTLRHPMVNAAGTAALAALAPGRVAVAFGTGFTGRRAMGYPAVPGRIWMPTSAPTAACCVAKRSNGRVRACACCIRSATRPTAGRCAGRDRRGGA